MIDVDSAFKAAIEQAKKDGLAIVHKAAIDFIQKAHREQLRTEPLPGASRIYVDGRRDVPIEQVRPGGIVQIDYSRISTAVEYAMNILFSLSPVRSGAYRDSHMILVNLQPVRDLSEWQFGDEIMITNPLPYSRVIEMGKMRMRVPGSHHVYQDAATIVRHRMADIASVRFTYRSLDLPYIGLGGRKGGKLALPHKRELHNREHDTRLPCLVFGEPGEFTSTRNR